MRPRGMTDEAIRQAQEEARGEVEELARKPHVEARAAQLRATVEDIRREWERKAAEGDLRARSLLRQCYPAEYAELDAATKVLARPVPAHWQEREPGEDGDA